MSSNGITLLICSLVTLLLGTAAHVLVLPWLRNRQIVDVPNHRSSHSTPTVRGGGIGIVAAMAGGLTVGSVLLPLAGANLQAAIWFGVTVVAFAVLGWVEDARGLGVRTRLGSQGVIAFSASMSAMALGGLPLGLAVLAGFGGVFYVNTANFMDGVNGISGWHGTLMGASYATMGLMNHSLGLVLAGLVTAAAFLSFLPWNAPRARMFMGDVGSYALGGAVWALCIFAVSVGAPLLVAVAPMMIYASDVVFTLLRRVQRRATLFEAHREHVYQRIQQITGCHGASTTLTAIATAACALISLVGLQSPSLQGAALMLVPLVVVLYLATPALLSLRQVGSAAMEVDT